MQAAQRVRAHERHSRLYRNAQARKKAGQPCSAIIAAAPAGGQGGHEGNVRAVAVGGVNAPRAKGQNEGARWQLHAQALNVALSAWCERCGKLNGQVARVHNQICKGERCCVGCAQARQRAHSALQAAIGGRRKVNTPVRARAAGAAGAAAARCVVKGQAHQLAQGAARCAAVALQAVAGREVELGNYAGTKGGSSKSRPARGGGEGVRR